MLTPEQAIVAATQAYMAELDFVDGHAIEDEDPLVDDALAAVCHAVDNVANEDDYRALTAWATKLRLQGEAEAHVASLMAVAEDIGRKLGLQL